MTNKSNNQIYIITHLNAHNVMRDIGRLREIAFRAAGGGTGLSMDIEEYDTMEHPYKQLIVWLSLIHIYLPTCGQPVNRKAFCAGCKPTL